MRIDGPITSGGGGGKSNGREPRDRGGAIVARSPPDDSGVARTTADDSDPVRGANLSGEAVSDLPPIDGPDRQATAAGRNSLSCRR